MCPLFAIKITNSEAESNLPVWLHLLVLECEVCFCAKRNIAQYFANMKVYKMIDIYLVYKFVLVVWNCVHFFRHALKILHLKISVNTTTVKAKHYVV